MLSAFHVPDIHGKDGFGDAEWDAPPDAPVVEDEPAAAALVRLAREKPKHYTLVAIGPLTNLALAVRMDPGFIANLDRLVIMGGSWYGKGNITRVGEFNFWTDPHAAHIVLSATTADMW